MSKQITPLNLELVEKTLDPDRPNRLCISLSDIHLTDGSVGFQNLGQHTWDAFYSGIVARCKNYAIEEMDFILDGDVVDMIRTDKWAIHGVYPWQREGEYAERFSSIVNEIIRDIVDDKHKEFFAWLRDLPQKLKDDAGVKKVNVVVLLGNHDKELFCDQKALGYFYEQGLGQKLEDIPQDYRRAIGRMYGDESMFANKNSAPYLPFYYGDRGFRFFTTHGQWRDKENSRSVKPRSGLPGWSAKQGWQNEVWKKLKFSPFFLPCFGDTVAAGVLSTFIYKSHQKLDELKYDDPRLRSILNELDLYRPTYKALTRLLEETKSRRKEKQDVDVIRAIENTLYSCVIEWLNWGFTYQSSSWSRALLLRVVKIKLKIMKAIGFRLEIKTIAAFLKLLNLFERWNPYHKTGVSFKEMEGFPAFMPEYQHYGFHIHGEGHTHLPLQEEGNFAGQNASTYINFGTWRDQIVSRKKSGYRRRSVLRALFILDLKDTTAGATAGSRSFNYYTDDIIHWSDKSDSFTLGSYQPHI